MSDDVMVMAGRSDRSATLGQLAKAKAAAQAKFLPLGKDKTADIATRTGGKYSYAYADLSTCLDAVIPALSEVGIALFQPVRIDEAKAIATTLLVHESNEFISGDFAVGIVDPTDARSVGSAATYARRYGLLSMLGYASGDGEDDDGEAARGGDHEQKPAASAPACPACGVVGSIMKGSPQYGGGILCWAKRGGCGVKWPEGTPYPPTAAPPVDPDPPKGRAKKEPVKPPKQSVAAESPAVSPAPAAESPEPPAGSEDCETTGCWGPRGHEGDHILEPKRDAPETAEPVAQPAPAAGSMGEGEPGPQSFMVGERLIETAGMSEAQFRESLTLGTRIDKDHRYMNKAKWPFGYSRELLRRMLGLPDAKDASRKNLTKAQGEQYLALQRAAAEAGSPQAEIKA